MVILKHEDIVSHNSHEKTFAAHLPVLLHINLDCYLWHSSIVLTYVSTSHLQTT